MPVQREHVRDVPVGAGLYVGAVRNKPAYAITSVDHALQLATVLSLPARTHSRAALLRTVAMPHLVWSSPHIGPPAVCCCSPTCRRISGRCAEMRLARDRGFAINNGRTENGVTAADGGGAGGHDGRHRAGAGRAEQ